MPANHGGIVAKTAVAVNLAEVGEDALNVVQGIRPHGMARQFGTLPRRQLASHLAAQSVHPPMHLLQLAARLLIVAGRSLQLLNLFLDAFEFGLALSKKLPY